MAVVNKSFRRHTHHQIKVNDFKIDGNMITYLATDGQATTMTRRCRDENPATLLADLMARGPDVDMVQLFMEGS